MADPQTEKDKAARRQGAAYQGAVEAVFAVLVGAGLGYWIDGRFDTAPIGLLVGVALGFTAFVMRLVRMGRQLQDEPEGGEDR